MTSPVSRPMHVGLVVAALLAVAAAPDRGRAAFSPHGSVGADKRSAPGDAVRGNGNARSGAFAQGTPATALGIVFATYLGGSADEEIREVIVDADGSLIVGGLTVSADFPVTPGAFQTVYKGEPPGTCHPGACGGDLMVARLAPDGSALRAATFLGGSKQDRNVYGMALDRAGDIVVTSATRSADMPTTSGAFQRQMNGTGDIHVSKLSADLTALRWCTYVGGSAGESPRGGLALDAQDRVYVVGASSSADFPTTVGAFQRQPKGDQDAVIFALEPDGSALHVSTRLGGSGTDGTMGVVFDPSGNVHIVGHTTSADFPVTASAAQRTHAGASDTYAAALTPDLAILLYATYLGGELDEWSEHRLRWLPDNSILFTGVTLSAAFPTTAGVIQRQRSGTNDGFLSKISARDGALLFSTLLGGSGNEFYLWPSPDAEGNIYLVGTTSSADFPVTADAVQSTYAGGDGDGVIAKLDPTGTRLLYATYLGGKGYDLIRAITFTPAGDLVVVGETSSSDFPVTERAFQRTLSGVSDGFVVKLSPSGVPASPTSTGTAVEPSPTPGTAATGTPSATPGITPTPAPASRIHLPLGYRFWSDARREGRVPTRNAPGARRSLAFCSGPG